LHCLFNSVVRFTLTRFEIKKIVMLEEKQNEYRKIRANPQNTPKCYRPPWVIAWLRQGREIKKSAQTCPCCPEGENSRWLPLVANSAAFFSSCSCVCRPGCTCSACLPRLLHLRHLLRLIHDTSQLQLKNVRITVVFIIRPFRKTYEYF
jgi:hypothetical protein